VVGGNDDSHLLLTSNRPAAGTFAPPTAGRSVQTGSVSGAITVSEGK